MTILANDNIDDHLRQRGVLRVFTRTVEALAERYGPAVLLCSSQRYPQLAVRQRRIARPPGRPGQLLDAYLGLHDRRASLVAARERAALVYSAYYGAVRARAPQAYTVYDMTIERFPEHFPRHSQIVRAFIAEKRRCLERGALLLAISETTARDLRAVYPRIDPAKIVVTPLGVEEVFLAEAPPPPSAARPYFVFAGNRGGYKNFLALLRAFARSGLAASHDLRVFSPGPDSFSGAERAEIGRHGLGPVVHLITGPSDEAVRALYAGAVALVYPSRFEGFGLPVLEAMASGALVATSRSSSLPEVGGDAAWYFDPDSDDAIAAAMALLAGLPADARRDAVARGRERARPFTWGRFKRLTVEAVERAVPLRDP
ncbi:MAG: glycosyltransferase family 4 protein [Chloroflexales bacterium]|nr:glycosyltransferase family 4 protein [Chloroflexales bacterium]